MSARLIKPLAFLLFLASAILLAIPILLLDVYWSLEKWFADLRGAR